MCTVGQVRGSRQASELCQKVLSEKIKFSSLNLAKETERRAAVECMNANTAYARKLNPADEFQRKTLCEWVACRYSNILLLNENQLHKDLVNIYLYEKFTKVEGYDKNKTIWLLKSYDKNICVFYNYETREGEIVRYFDKQLALPIKLKTTAKVKLKIVDSLELVKKIDLDLSQIDLNLAVVTLHDLINKCIRNVVLKVIEENDATFFDLSKYYQSMGERAAKDLRELCLGYGLSVADVSILNIVIPNNATEKLENQYFALAEAERIKNFENEMAEQALKRYEEKAAIHEKYPNFPLTLTEAEKDFALNRYLKRTGEQDKYEADIVNEKLKRRLFGGLGTKTTATESTWISPKKRRPSAFLILLTLCILVGCFTMIASVVAGLIILGCTSLIFGLTAAFAWDKIKIFNKKSKETGDEEKEDAYFVENEKTGVGDAENESSIEESK